MSDDRTYGKCGNCKTRFPLSTWHVSYGGLLWCSEDCLAEYSVENDFSGEQITKVERTLKHRKNDG